MPSPQYVKGRKKEYKIRNELLKQGYDIVQRSAGSHSPVDVWAISQDKKEILLVQCKPEGYKERKYEEYGWLNDEFVVKFIIK